MATMKTLTINGVKYDIVDDEAVRLTQQSLTETEKTTVRKNIGALEENEYLRRAHIEQWFFTLEDGRVVQKIVMLSGLVDEPN